MPSRSAAGLGLKADWDLGENNWKDEMDLNLVELSVLVGGKVLSRVSATPGAPAEGDVHIFKSDHPTNANAIAAYDEAAWKYFTPLDGMMLFSVADGATYEFRTGAGWIPAAGILIRTTQVAAYTATIGDANAYVPMNHAAAANFTVPANADVPFPIGTRLVVEQRGAGQTTIVGAAGVTLRSRDAAFKTAGQYAVVQIIQTAADVWVVTGDVTA